MTVLLVRHASAGDRSDWEGDDALRPIDAGGRRQAKGLAELEYGVTRVLSSPAVRCVQTVAPLAERLGLPVEERGELDEGSSRDTVGVLLEELADETAVLCTHGDVIQDLIGEEPPKGA
ncbi:MAG: histidine phosphatase family protein, partial [Actinobacteria bacterium]|nr:histidine phosphatase family protein [Actinomycetota bacterium]